MYQFRFSLSIYFLIFPYFLHSQTLDCSTLSSEMDSLYKEGKIKDSLGDYEGSLKNYESAEEIRLKIEDACTEDTILVHANNRKNHLNFRRGQANVQLGQHTKARPYLEKAYEEFKGDNYNSLMGRIIYLMILETRMGYFKFAKKYEYKGDLLIKQHGNSINPLLISNFYKNVGQLYYEMDICDIAQIKFDKANEFAVGDIQKIEIKNGEANNDDKNGEYEKSISKHRSNIKKLKALNNSQYLREAYLNISHPYMKSEQYKEAVKAAKTSMSYCPKDDTGNICRANACNNLSDAYRMAGQLNSAAYYAHQSLIHHLKEEGFF